MPLSRATRGIPIAFETFEVDLLVLPVEDRTHATMLKAS